MKILNLFAGLGGNRLPWGTEHQVTAIELEPRIAAIYKQRFPKDEVIEGDAYSYLEQHFHEFDFIWASPPCPSHSKISRTHTGRRYKGWNMSVQIPDMRLYGIIIFLQEHFRGDWIVENVTPFYVPLIVPSARVGRHVIWSNKFILDKKFNTLPIMFKIGRELEKYYEILCASLEIEYELIEEHVHANFSYRNDWIGQVLRNTVTPEVAAYLWHQIWKQTQQTLVTDVMQ